MSDIPSISTATTTIAYPSFFRRFGIVLYELLLVFAVIFFANYLFDTLTQSKHALMFRVQRQIWMFLVLGLYFVLAWRWGGQTLAMKTWGVKLIKDQETPLTWKTCVVRYLLAWCSFLSLVGILWMFWDKDKQFLHDRILGTRLIINKALKF